MLKWPCPWIVTVSCIYNICLVWKQNPAMQAGMLVDNKKALLQGTFFENQSGRQEVLSLIPPARQEMHIISFDCCQHTFFSRFLLQHCLLKPFLFNSASLIIERFRDSRATPVNCVVLIERRCTQCMFGMSYINYYYLLLCATERTLCTYCIAGLTFIN